MAEDSVYIVKSRSEVTESAPQMTKVALDDNGDYEMFVKDTGYAETVYVGLGCSLEVRSGGSVADVALAGGSSSRGFLSIYGTASNVKNSGTTHIYGGGTLTDCTIAAGGSLQAYANSLMEGVQVLSGGYIFGSGTAVFKNMTVDGGARLALDGCRLENAVIQAGANVDYSNCTLKDCTVLGNLTGSKGKTLTIEGTLTLGGKLSGWENLCLQLTECKPADQALLASWTAGTESNSISARLSSLQSSGKYRLVGQAAGFNEPLTLSWEDGEWKSTLALGERISTENTRYALQLDGETLNLTVANRQLFRITRGESNVCLQAWWEPNDPVCLYGRDMDATVQKRDFFVEEFTAATPQQFLYDDEPARLEAALDGTVDVFLATPTGKWNFDFVAENIFTGTIKPLNGLNRFEDVFVGNADEEAALMLTDEDDAIFADDIFSAFAEGKENRLQKIVAIHAGAGNDLVDLTCCNIASETMACVVMGGTGDDILWGGTQAAVLIGGDGNDQISTQRDGAIIAFDSNWGNDTLQVAENMDYRLWFAEGTELDISYDDFGARISCGMSSVDVEGVFSGINEKILIGNADGLSFNGYKWTDISGWLC